MTFPDKKYEIIYADPPWSYNDQANAGERGACHKYDVMDMFALADLPVWDIAAKNCLLAMWHVGPMPLEALYVMKAWGFTLKTMKGFTWHKTTKNGRDHFGMGHLTRANTEDCLFAVRGKPVRASGSVRQIVHAQVREHSRKPDEIRNALVELLGDIPRIELFARQKHEGWDHWGNEL